MAKSFGGFTPVQQKSLLSKMGYDGPAQQDDINKFMMASPRAAAMMGKYATLARGILEPSTRGFAVGGVVDDKLMNAITPNPTATGLQHPSTLPENAGVTPVNALVTPLPPLPKDSSEYEFIPPEMVIPPEMINPLGLTVPGSGSVTPLPGTPAPKKGKGRDYFAELQAGKITEDQYLRAMKGEEIAPVPGWVGGGRTYNTAEGVIVTFDPDKETFFDAQGNPYTGTVQIEGGPSYQVYEGVNPEFTGVNAYDPTTGMPMPVGGTGDVDAYLKGDGAVPDFMKDSIKSIIESGNIPADPNKYTITGGPGNWTITFENGASFTSPNLNPASAENDAKMAAASLSGYTGGTDTDLYQSQLGEYQQYQTGLAQQATADPLATLNSAQQNLANQQALLVQYNNELMNMPADDPRRASLMKLIEDQQLKINQASYGVEAAKSTVANVSIPSTDEARATAFTDPMSMVTQQEVTKFTPEQTEAGKIAATTGQAPATAEQASVTQAQAAADVVAPDAKEAATYEATTVLEDAKAELEKAKPAVGKLSEGATFEGEQGVVSAKSLASETNTIAENRILKVNEKVNLEVTKDQLAEAKGKNLQAIEAKIAQSDSLKDAVAQTSQVQPEELPPAAIIAESQMAQAQAMQDAGLVPDAVPIAAKLANFSVDDGTLAKAMTGEVSALATVEGQLSQLMKDFDDGTPAWAAGAIRAANAVMAARGIGASSMASAAILQAAMESALPIAQQDAQTFAQMDMQNLSNRHQVALANAAAQQGLSLQNLSNEQQANLQKSAQAFALQEANLSNRQAAEIANAQIRASLQGQNLSNQQQSNIAVAARYAEAANINLNNKQQAAMQTNANQLQTNLANLSSKSQAYITNANLAASLQGQVLSNEQQVAINNAARFAEAANITFTTQQQNALHNSTLMQTIGLAELDANMAATLQNAATYAGMDMANLNNRQQAAVHNAKAFLEMDMANLNNEQQMAMFKAQSVQQALLADAAAENAAKQFNATSENQTNQFYDNLTAQIDMQNQEQKNAMERFNAGEANAIAQFNASQQNARDQFNANNELVVAQANAQWDQMIATTDNAAQNQANRDAALAATGMTENTYNNMLQQERDIMDYAWRTVDNALARESNLTIAEMQVQAEVDAAKGSALGGILGKVVSFALPKVFGA